MKAILLVFVVISTLIPSIPKAFAAVSTHKTGGIPSSELSVNSNYVFTVDQLNQAGIDAVNEADIKLRELGDPTAQVIVALAFFNRDPHTLQDQEAKKNHSVEWNDKPESSKIDIIIKDLTTHELVKSYSLSYSLLIEKYRRELIFEKIHEILKAQNKDVSGKIHWAWNQAANGPHAKIGILYCSTNEYIALFGSEFNLSGYSGLYPHMDVRDIMFLGEMTSYQKSTKDPIETFSPGQVSLLERGKSVEYQTISGSYMIDYGRGRIAGGIMQGIIGPWLFLNFDTESMETQVGECIKSFIKRLRSN